MENPSLYLKIQQQLSDRNLKVVSDRIGISHDKLCRIARGESKRPSLEDISKIMNYLEG